MISHLCRHRSSSEQLTHKSLTPARREYLSPSLTSHKAGQATRALVSEYPSTPNTQPFVSLIHFLLVISHCIGTLFPVVLDDRQTWIWKSTVGTSPERVEQLRQKDVSCSHYSSLTFSLPNVMIPRGSS